MINASIIAYFDLTYTVLRRCIVFLLPYISLVHYYYLFRLCVLIKSVVSCQLHLTTYDKTRNYDIDIFHDFWVTACKTVRPMLSDRCLSVCSVLSVTFVHCGQTVGQIKMKLGMQVGLGPGHIVLDRDPVPPPAKGHSNPPIFGP